MGRPAWSPDGRVLVTAGIAWHTGHLLIAWDARTGEPLTAYTLEQHPHVVRFDARRTLTVAAGDRVLRLSVRSGASRVRTVEVVTDPFICRDQEPDMAIWYDEDGVFRFPDLPGVEVVDRHRR